MKFCAIPLPPAFEESSLCPAYPAHWSLSNHLTIRSTVAVLLVFKGASLLNNGLKEEEE